MRIALAPLAAALAAASACTGAAADSSTDAAARGGHCINGPEITITSPVDASSVAPGDTVDLVAEATSEVDAAQDMLILWSITVNGGDEVADGKGTQDSWVTSSVGDFTIRAQVEDSCAKDATLEIDPAQDSVRIGVH